VICDEPDRVIRQRAPPARELPVLNVETSAAAHEPELGRDTLASQQALLVTQQRPFLDQLVEFDRSIHDR
jgi:hypothetical protein